MRKRGFLHPAVFILTATSAFAQPSKVLLTSPANNAGSVAIVPSFSWSPADGAVTYELQLARRSNMKQLEIDATGITGTSYTLKSELDESLTYYWRVRAIGDANGPWSDVWSFTTGQLPDAVILSSPANQESGVPVSPELTWVDASGASSYELEVSLESSFSSLVYAQSGIAATSVVLPITLDNETRYYWHVRGSNSVGDGPFSSTEWFETIVSKPDQVLLSSPADGATGVATTPTLVWQETSGADSYGLEVSETPGFETLLVDADAIATTSFDVATPFANGTVLYWRVRATNVAGDGPFSTMQDFTTIAGGPTQVQLVAPADGATDVEVSPSLIWQAVDGASTYRIQLAATPDFSGSLIDDTVVAGTQLQVGPLGLSVTYYWRVLASNAGSQNWSDVSTFVTTNGLPGQVVLDEPAADAADQPLAPTLSWVEPARAETYNLEVGLDAEFSVILVSETGLTSTARQLETLAAETDYYWRVRAVNAVGAGAWSNGRKFTTRMLQLPATPALIYPPDESAGVSVNPVFAWNEAEGAESYKLELSTSPPDEFENFTTVVTAVVVTQPFFQSPVLSPGQEHYWRVEARNEEGSTQSAVWRFRTTVATASETEELPADYDLHPNYPNPFNPSTTIRFDVPEPATVRIAVYDALGRMLETLVDGHQPAGRHAVTWDATGRPSGTYFVRMEAASYAATQRMVLLR